MIEQTLLPFKVEITGLISLYVNDCAFGRKWLDCGNNFCEGNVLLGVKGF
jgi:hypothetical protein